MKQFYKLCMSMLISTSLVGNAAMAQHEQGQPTNLGSCKTLLQDIRQKTSSTTLQKTSSVIALPVSSSEKLNAKVNFKKAEGTDQEYLVGEIAGVPGSDFHIRVNGNSVEGSIVMKGSKKAYKYFSDASGNAFVEEADINDVICVEYDHQESSAPTSSKALALNPAVANLQSLPGANGCVLLDFDGHYVSGTPWNGGNPINAAPSGMSDAAIQECWEVVAEDFRPFSMNITTNEAVFNSYPKNRRMRCIITPTNTAAPGAGGVAYIGSFAWNDDTPCWVFILSGKSGGEASSHEIGHTLDLGHDGRTSPSEGYYRGHGDWAPIMGVGYYEPISQWSKGEYANANNKEDDLAKITGTKFGVGYRADDHGNSTGGATGLQMDAAGNVSSGSNKGIIERTSDLDFFRFTTGGGAVTLNFTTVSRHGNLDILVRLYNSSGGLISTHNPAGLTSSINTSLAAGTYYISIDGTGAGDPLNTGYSDYASLGSFFISGKVPVGTNPNVRATFYQHCNYDASGYAIGLEPGNYTTAQLNARGIQNNDISSLRVTSGFEVVVYDGDNFSGASQTFGADDPCLVDNSINDWVSSLRVRQLNQLPSVSITAPSNGASFTAPATITISASASDADGTVSKVEFFNGATKLGEDLTSPYSISWSSVGTGTYTLSARATDNAGGVRNSSSVTVTVNAAPVGVATMYKHCNFDASGYAIVLPVGDYTTAQLTARGISNNDISSLRVNSGYEVVLYDGDNFSGTSQTFQAEDACLVDNGINDWTSSLRVRSVVVNQAPSVSIASPSSGASFTAPASITIAANASDAGGSVVKVEFFNGSAKLGEDLTSPYSLTWSNVAAGNYTITARATDNNGAVTTSAAVSVSVAQASTCSGVAQYVENGGYVAGSVVQNSGKKYTCKPWPYSGWCNGAAWAYAPGTGAYWSDAWTESGSCSSAAAAAMSEELKVSNPVTNVLNISFSNTGITNGDIQLLDAFGKQVWKMDNVSSDVSADVSGLSSGMYVLVIRSGDQVISQRIVKQ